MQASTFDAFWRRMVRARAWLIPGFVVALIGLGIAFGVYAQKTFERNTYMSLASGSACHAPARTTLPISTQLPLKSFTFGTARFQYARGGVACQMINAGRLYNDADLPACVFDHPYFVRVDSGPTTASYIIPFGGASVIMKDSSPVCSWRKS